MTQCKRKKNPMEANTVLTSEDCPQTPAEQMEMSKYPYREGIGCVMYAMVGTRPDIAFTVGSLSRFVSNPGLAHWKAFRRLLRYLKETVNEGIMFYRDSDSRLNAYVDADWAGDVDERKSTTGLICKFGTSPIYWKSKKQACVTLSSTEAEYVAACRCAQDLVWLRRLYNDFGLMIEDSIKVYEDNQSCLHLIKREKMKNRTKHIDVKYHYVREQVKNGNLEFEYCNTENQEADLLTKALTGPRTVLLKNKMNIQSTPKQKEEHIDYMYVVHTVNEEQKDESLEFLRQYRMRRSKNQFKKLIGNKDENDNDVKVDVSDEISGRKQRFMKISCVAMNSLKYASLGLGSSRRLMYSSICWSLARLKNTYMLIRSVSRQLRYMRESPELKWVSDFNFNVLSGSILTDPIESSAPLDEEMMRLYELISDQYGNSHFLGTTNFWKTIVHPSVEIGNIDKILVSNPESLSKYLTLDGHPTNLLKRKIVLNHKNISRQGIYYNRWGFRVPFNIQHIDHTRFLLECQNCHGDYLYCFCNVEERICRKPVVSMRPPRKNVARIMRDNHYKRMMKRGKQEACSDEDSQNSDYSDQDQFDAEIEALLQSSDDESVLQPVKKRKTMSLRSDDMSIDEEKFISDDVAEKDMQEVLPTLTNSSPFIAYGVHGAYNDCDMSVLVIRHHNQASQRDMLQLQEKLVTLQKQFDDYKAMQDEVSQQIGELEVSKKSLLDDLKILKEMDKMMQKRKAVVAAEECRKFADVTLASFDIYLEKKPITERKIREKELYKKGVAAGLQWVKTKKEKNYLASARKVFNSYAFEWVMKFTFRDKRELTKKPSLKFVVTVLTILSQSQEEVLKCEVARDVVMGLGTIIQLMRGNAIIARANGSQGMGYPRLLESYAEALASRRLSKRK